MTKELNVEEKMKLITRNLQEVLSEEELFDLLKKKKEPVVYWGTMPTGSVSIAYFFPMLKIADLLNAGLKVKILLADLHAILDGVSWKIVEKRYEYYREAIQSILRAIGVDIKKLEFVRGRDLQLNKDYFYDLLKLSTLASVHDSTRAASEAVKTAQGSDVKLAGLIYPLMQALDEEYLKVDIQFAGLDQRKIQVFAREYLPKIGYRKRVELMNPMIRGLVGDQMRSSVKATKIDLLDSEKEVEKRVRGADFVSGNAENGVMALFKYFIFILKRDGGEKVVVERPEKFGGNLEYDTYEKLEKDVLDEKVHPLDIKNALAKELNKILDKIRTEKLKKLYREAYS
jgi:tyrosyl-tRNA synthetase